MRKLFVFIVLPIAICLVLLFHLDPGRVSTAQTADPTPKATQTSPTDDETTEEVKLAVYQEIGSRSRLTFVYNAFTTRLDRINISGDKLYASAWMEIVDTQSGLPVPAEPGLALLQYLDGAWEVTLPGDQFWEDWLDQSPGDVLDPGEKAFWQMLNADYLAQQPQAAIPGYRLPWEGGMTVYLSGSVSHDAYIPSGNAHYAFDFYIPGQMFNIHASRSGTVYLFRDSQPNGDASDPGNYLVLKDTTTNPVTYQLYLHLAQGSIPTGLKSVGIPVSRGQFIGIADDTGMSTGHHLHYQVHTNPASYWGRAVDITFDDVDINGGRPRVRGYYNDEPYCTWPDDVCVDFRSAYVSGNTIIDPNPPQGGFTGIDKGDLIQSQFLTINGWAADAESGIKQVQVIAAYNGSFYDIGPLFTTVPFSFSWDVCQTVVPDGPVSLGMRIYDNESNIAFLPGLVTVTKSYRCQPPPPSCQPGLNQIALFAAPDYQGSCTVLPIGSYPTGLDLGIGDNNLASIQVGSGVRTTVYDKQNFLGRSETFQENDSNLDDNLVRVDQVTSIRVAAKTQTPSIPKLVWPTDGFTNPAVSSLTFYWSDQGYAEDFQVRLMEGGVPIETSAWMQKPYWSIGTMLGTGQYTWQVRAQNSSGVSGWSPPQGLIISAPGPGTLPTGNLPFSDTVESGTNGWTFSGLWHRQMDPSPIDDPDGSYFWWFGESASGDERYFSYKSGELSSPKFTLPTGSQYYLRFNYAYQTESRGVDWDQRWVQISVDGGPFTNMLQLSSETMTNSNYAVWLASPAVDLSPYAGSQIQIRFFFDTIDPTFNSPDNDFEGWYIDDITITTTAPPLCTDQNEPNNIPNLAVFTSYSPDSLITGMVCPNGDVDYFKFNGNAGDLVTADIDAKVLGSKLDSVLTLFDQDGQSVLAENDDEDYSGGLLDSLLRYRLPRTGEYFLRLQPWDYPAGGADYSYSLKLFSDDNPPDVTLLIPDGTILGSQPITISAQASDSESELVSVNFYWHSSLWTNPGWIQLVGSQQNGDVWSTSFDPGPEIEGSTGAFYAQAVDAAGNVMWDGSWGIIVDHSPPETQVLDLAPVQDRTVFKLTWEGSDQYSGLDHFDLEEQVDTAAWQEILTNVPSETISAWVQGDPGHLYAYRSRGVDLVGQMELYPSTADAVTFIPSADVLCSSLDSFENDNDKDQAVTTSLDSTPTSHTFCRAGSYINDEDWIKFVGQSDLPFTVTVSPEPGSPAQAEITLYRLDGSNLIELSRVSAGGFGSPVWVSWLPAADGDFFVRIRSVDGDIIGTGIRYQILVNSGAPEVFYLPLVTR